MSTTSNPRDRLEALLTGLEDEVLRMDDRAALSPDEDGSTTDAGELRLSMESAIASAIGDAGRPRESLHQIRKEPIGKVAKAMKLLGSWGGVKQGDGRPGGAPRVRMAFSGDQEPADAETADRRTRRSRRETESEDKES